MLSNVRAPRSRPVREPQRIRARPRIMVACINCKERKLKCDDQVPACVNCRRFSLTVIPACQVEDPITKRYQPRNYLEILENKIAALEESLRQARSEVAQDCLAHTDLPDFAVELPAANSPRPQSIIPSGDQSETTEALSDDTIINELASKVGMLEMNVAGGEPHYLGSSSAFAFSRAIGSTLLLQGLQPIPERGDQLSASHSHPEDHFDFLPCLLPDYDDGQVLSNAYFRNIHPQYPFLNKSTFKAWEAEILHPDQFSSQNPVASYFIYMVYAVGALLLPRLGYSSEVQQLRHELETWRSTAPPAVNHRDQALSLFGQDDWYDVNYSYSILLLHRRHLTNTKKEVPDEVILECLQAAENICSRYRRQYVGGSVGYTWGAIHFIFLAGLTYLHCLWISPAARKSRRHDTVSSTCTDCTMVLVVMAERWTGATPYRDIFETLSKRTITMMTDLNMTHNNTDTGGLGGVVQDPWAVTQSVMDMATDSVVTTKDIDQAWWTSLFDDSIINST
ncbi:hypothetical protein G7054_g357 [Neopestalotiopsis clavispora]|nr:hypothetical protein G7054_g357 [Neopestalotiopsis clavispora]